MYNSKHSKKGQFNTIYLHTIDTINEWVTQNIKIHLHTIYLNITNTKINMDWNQTHT
jgi:hypothetical protein